jgi:signal transduction histidine kinase
MSRLLSIWLAFAICLAVVLAAMGWISLAAVRLGRAEAEARRQALTEEKTRLALWRIDSALAPMLAQESARSYFAYQAFFPADLAPYVLLHFQIGPDGTFTSPQAPSEPFGKVLGPAHLDAQRIEKARMLLGQLAAEVSRQKLLKLLPKQPPSSPAESLSLLAPSAEQRLASRQRLADLQQRGQGIVEFNLRNEAVQQNANVAVQSQAPAGQSHGGPDVSLTSTTVGGVLMTPLWSDGRLLLARRITAGGREYVQGCLLDWPAIRTSLLETIADLLPEANLQPVTAAGRGDESRMLAALPVRLVPGLAPNEDGRAGSPIVLSLCVAWACVLAAAAAVAALLWGVVRLSERRAAFVSAVTHELRTPLTTFQMYAEMLAEGMVPDARQQRHYLDTLRAEAVRLTHLVENVLAYARLERGRRNARTGPIALGELIAGVQNRLTVRAEQAGMSLVTEGIEQHGAAMIMANPSAAEQVLFNLVDNACKYASAAADKRIHLTGRLSAGVAEILVRDHGPGVSAAMRRRLFRSFSKSAEEAAHSAPGIGLGLALSRRLARDMGGDLRLDPNVADGACFILGLPRE